MAEELVLSPEELVEQEILQQDDAVEITFRDLSRVGGPVVWIAYESRKLNRRVTSIYEYYELKDVNGAPIGYQQWGQTKYVSSAGVSVSEERVRIVGSRRRGE